ncbi:hypothetical protein RND71_003153 [Anisodus tanguticus]|uniref:Uncharacterized protein n=1 Tax=Anisodus tanguticus TaxID=243964 RepID=A0AAE1SVD7_9SOLA|nr:hypothetical protein RND71_003153 [Anisodus tanguticus]
MNTYYTIIAKFIGAIKNMSDIKIKCQKGAGIVDGCCIVVEYVPKGTVRSYLSKHAMKKKLPLDTVIQLALDAAKGKDKIGKRLTAEGRKFQPLGLVLSQPAYDHKCDVYSFGICLWKMYTCLDPYLEQIPRSKTSHEIYKSLDDCKRNRRVLVLALEYMKNAAGLYAISS